MQKLHLDTNIILDFLGNRQPFVKAASRLFLEGHRKHLQLFCSSGTITTAYYFLEKQYGVNGAKQKIRILLKYVSVIAVTRNIIEKTVDSAFHDFEDGIEYFAAREEGKIDFIITRNKKDFSKSSIPVLSGEEFVMTQL